MANTLALTQRQIVGWCGQAIYDEGESRCKRGEVLRADVDGDTVTGILARPSGTMTCRFKVLPNGLVDSTCACFANREQGIVCAHVAAAAIFLMRRSADPERQQRHLDEQRHARRKAAFLADGVVIILR